MVSPLRCYLTSVAIAFAVLQSMQIFATPLQDDPVTECSSFDLSNKNFPGRGAEVEDDGTCTVTSPKAPTPPNFTNNPTVPVVHKGLLANASKAPSQPVYTRVGTPIISEQMPADSDPDAYVKNPTTITVSPKPEPDKFASPSISSSSSSLHNTYANLEAYFGSKMELKLKNLPSKAVCSLSPWGGSDWAAYKDGINFVWNRGQPSAAEKYARAFGLNVRDFMNKVSANNGIDARNQLPICTTDNDCSPISSDSTTVCGIRANKKSGYCIPLWFSICHAWSLAAILESEPNCPVMYNGVTFQPMDIKALITDVYDGAIGDMSFEFSGLRYYGDEDSLDKYGGHTNPAYRDLNPGVFHTIAANLLGKLNTTFILDRDPSVEVWTQPVVGFKVQEQTAMTTKKAAQTFYGLEKYPWNDEAKSIVYIKSHLSWINETLADGGLVASKKIKKYTVGKTYDYVLELNDAEEIIGGEWLYDSKDEHPDYLWLPTSKPVANLTTSIGLSYAHVKMLLEKSVKCSKN